MSGRAPLRKVVRRAWSQLRGQYEPIPTEPELRADSSKLAETLRAPQGGLVLELFSMCSVHIDHLWTWKQKILKMKLFTPKFHYSQTRMTSSFGRQKGSLSLEVFQKASGALAVTHNASSVLDLNIWNMFVETSLLCFQVSVSIVDGRDRMHRNYGKKFGY